MLAHEHHKTMRSRPLGQCFESKSRCDLRVRRGTCRSEGKQEREKHRRCPQGARDRSEDRCKEGAGRGHSDLEQRDRSLRETRPISEGQAPQFEQELSFDWFTAQKDQNEDTPAIDASVSPWSNEWRFNKFRRLEDQEAKADAGQSVADAGTSDARETMVLLRRVVVTDSPRRHVMALSFRGGTRIVRIARLDPKGKKCKDLTTAIAIGWKGRKSISSRMMLRLDGVQLADYIEGERVPSRRK